MFKLSRLIECIFLFFLENIIDEQKRLEPVDNQDQQWNDLYDNQENDLG